MRNISLLTFLLIFGIISCTPGRMQVQKGNDAIKITPSKYSKNSPDWNGLYAGIVPCADCEGIETEIKLNNDFTCEISRRYFGKSDQVYLSAGTFKWNDSNNKIVLRIDKEQSNQNQYLLGENMLIKLDVNGKMIEGALSEMYILKKVVEDREITEKYWKLIELMGEKVSVNTGKNNEAHFILQTASNRVVGDGGCNSFSGTYQLSDGYRIRFSKMVSTKMACLNMEIENEFLKVFESADNYTLKGDTLSLNKARMAPLAKFVSGFLK
jgi:copper homeostasis protein (lipoprotein)